MLSGWKPSLCKQEDPLSRPAGTQGLGLRFPRSLYHYQALFSPHTRELRMNSSLTNAALAFHFISGGADAPERSLQILTGPRRTRARKRHTLIGIFREKEEEEEKKCDPDGRQSLRSFLFAKMVDNV